MVIGLRILALIIDCFVCFLSLWGAVHASGWIFEHSGRLSPFIIPLWFILFIAWPFIYFGIPTGLWGRTLGKLLCRLEVCYSDGGRLGVSRGLGRETLKLLSIFSVFGVFFCAFQILHQGTTWYDTICGTRVESKSGIGLTKMQKRSAGT